MAVKKKRRASFLDGLGRFVPLFVFLALIVNAVVVVRFELTRKPQVVYSVERVLINTNASDSVTSPAPSASPLPSSPFPTNTVDKVACQADYDYFLYNGVRGVKMWDRFFNEGSLTSWGRILTIFPDRIQLEDGSWIVNRRWLGGFNREQLNKGVVRD